MTKPIDFGEVLRHIAAARNLPDPHPAAVDELARALARIRPDAIRAAVREWLDADTSGRLPLPGHLLPIAQRHARLLTLAARNDPNTLNELTVCAWCDGTRFIEVDEGSVVPCQRCIPSTYSRWKRGHFHPNHNEGQCAECNAMHSNNRPVASAIASEVDMDPRPYRRTTHLRVVE